MLFKGMSDAEIRQICKERIETLEFWLRRLIDQEFLKIDSDYFNFQDEKGNRLIKRSIADKVIERQSKEPERYSRYIDATLFDDLINLICNPANYNNYFKKYFIKNFPNGSEVVKFYLQKIYEPRNNLAHANPISLRQAEQIICYVNDILDSIKYRYKELGGEKMFNVPQIIQLTDSFGNIFQREQMAQASNGIIKIYDEKRFYQIIDTNIAFELEIDSSFPTEEYNITWKVVTSEGIDHFYGKRIDLLLKEKHISANLYIIAEVISNKSWHKHQTFDDKITIMLTVLPPA
ncbi:hypothetical protein [Acinetobacter baumannii]|uniref:hypothetical protein n=1 Tax=Acinetobacter baumannii TaxID=470 RepID=UPI00292BC176|nr:hypothetical protein [Acinetobacter baumannii]